MDDSVPDSDEVVAGAEREVEPTGGEPEVQTVDGIPVPAEVMPLERAELVALERVPTAAPALQVAAAAATGFVAGAATMALMRRAGRRAPVTGQPRPLASGETRTYLVRVRLISRP